MVIFQDEITILLGLNNLFYASFFVLLSNISIFVYNMYTLALKWAYDTYI